MNNIKIKVKNEEIEVNLLNDFLFTKLFGETGCEKETLHLINTFTERNFKSLTYKPKEFKGEHQGNKMPITDVLVEIDDNSIVNIESQIKKQKKFHKRIQFYNSKIYSLQLKVGETHETLPMTFMINFLGFNLHKLEDYHTIFMFYEKNNRDYALDDLIELHYIELTRLRNKVKKVK